MARPSPVRRAWRSLIWLGVILVALVGASAASVAFDQGSWTPKLGLDLEGGTQLILAAQVENGQTVSQDQLDQAVAIIRQRVDAGGVSEAEITTQGSQNIVVSIPGKVDDATRSRIESSAKLEFRPVLLTEAAPDASVGSPGATPTPTPGLSNERTAAPTNGSDLAYITPALQAQYDGFDCASLGSDTTNVAPANEPLVTCQVGASGDQKFLLGPVEVSGDTISNATSGQSTNSQGVTTGQWVVNLTFDGDGTQQFKTISERLVNLESPRNQFGIVLDGKVIEAPVMNQAIPNGQAQISGNFTQASSKALADQLKFGALPISFKLQSSQAVSATLGTSQLASGLLAGLIGLILVVLYSLLQYRSLASVTILSLIVSSVITYFVVLYLSNEQNYRLSLAGVAGLVVAIGITADSFIVYFERIRDELRDGRGLESAVSAGWRRAIRTILASDAVNLLAAVVLYLLAVGNVQGFAFTLGVTTVVDVVVVSLFTHPALQLLARVRFFAEGHRFSGLDPKALGAVYRGRAQFRAPVATAAGRAARSAGEAQRRQTIAERKAAEDARPTVGAGRRGGSSGSTGSGGTSEQER